MQARRTQDGHLLEVTLERRLDSEDLDPEVLVHLESCDKLSKRYAVIRADNQLDIPPLLEGTFSSAQGAIAFPILYIDASGAGNQEWILGSSDAFVLYFDDDPALLADTLLTRALSPKYNVVAPPDCEASTTPLPPLTNPSQVHLQIGDAFFTRLPDLNCDGNQHEWAVLCAYGCGDPS